MNKIFLDLGIIQIKWYSLFIFIAMLVASILIYREARRKKIDDDTLFNMLFYGIIIGILGARFYYVLFNLNYYLKYPLEILMIWNGGLAIHGGLLAGLLFMAYYSKKHKINILGILDILVVGVIIAQSIGRWGNFFNQEAYGGVISLSTLKSMHLPQFIIDGMYIDGAYRTPTFLYESFSSLLCFIVLILLRKTKKIHTGQLTGMYLSWYGIERFFIEGLRTDSLMLGNIRIAQLVSLLFLLSGIILIIYSYKKNKKYGFLFGERRHYMQNIGYVRDEEHLSFLCVNCI